MSIDPAEYGPALYAYIEQHLRAQGTNLNAWCDQHPGMHGPTVTRWRQGSMPRVDAYRAVADALGVSLVDVFAGTRVLSKAETSGRASTTPAAPSLDAALRFDDTVPETYRRTLTDLLRALRDVEAGAAQRVVKSPRRTR